jgi:hypothetical protein
MPGQLTAGKGEVFSDYDTSLVDSDHVVAVAKSEASGDEAMDLEHMDIPVETVEAALPVSRSFTAVTTDDTQEVDEASGTLRRGTCALIHRCAGKSVALLFPLRLVCNFADQFLKKQTKKSRLQFPLLRFPELKARTCPVLLLKKRTPR